MLEILDKLSKMMQRDKQNVYFNLNLSQREAYMWNNKTIGN